MAKNPLLTATEPNEMLKILSGDDFTQAAMLHQLGETLHCKIEPRTGAHYYRIQYSTKKPKRTLFTIECNEKRWRVKANLCFISSYSERVLSGSTTIKDAIISTRTCTKCNSRCIGGTHFKLHGHAYFTCIGSGHFFENLTGQEWSELAELLKLENSFLNASK